MMRGVRKVLRDCLNVKSGEKVVIVTDTNKTGIAEAFAAEAYAEGAEVVICVMTPRTRHAEEPPEPVAAAMMAADVILAPTTYSLTHTKARIAATDEGARVANLPGYNVETLVGGAMEVDFLKIKPIVEKVDALFTKSKNIKVSTAPGTDLKLSIEGRKGVAQTSVCHEPGTFSPPPCIMPSVAPVEGTTEGVLIVDGLVVPYVTDGPLKNSIKVVFEKGRIVDIRGGEEALGLRRLLEGYKHPNVYLPVQLGLGMNPKARMGLGRGSAEDEGQYGTLIIGLGEGRTFGSSISAPAHIDLLCLKPTIELDGQVIMRDGELTIEGAQEALGKPEF